ncbi:MAG: PadR family transcriptional regulator [Chloroflexota bacterium]|nr:PadR family transcriptional regulator [Chloroflexota bacterium]
MFGKRFAYEYQGAEGEGWTPPWLRRERDGYGPHFHEGRHGHGPFGPRAHFFGMRRGRGPFPFGPGGQFGPGSEGPRFFGRGDVKFALLELLQERPMHGYEMMKALEEKSGGFYTPSAGSIYPTLQMLEDRGFVTVKDVEGKKVYTITDEGRTLLAERQKNDEEFVGPPWMRHRGGRPRFSPEMQALKSEAMEVVRLLTIAGRMSFQDPEKMTRLRGVIERTRKDLSDMIYSSGSQQGHPSSTASTNQADGPSIEEA